MVNCQEPLYDVGEYLAHTFVCQILTDFCVHIVILSCVNFTCVSHDKQNIFVLKEIK